MNPQTWQEAAQQVANEIVELLTIRQKDYGHENILAFGELGILVRVNDKVARLKNLILKKKEAAGERKLDSWIDLGGYSIISIMLDRGWFTLELGE